MQLFAPASLMTLASVLVGCGPAGPDDSVRRWDAPSAYAYTVESTCGERNFLGRFHVVVRGGEVADVEGLDARSRELLDQPEHRAAVPTLTEILDEADRARAEDADLVEVVRDDATGRPIRIEIDWLQDATDDEACYDISDYVAPPPDPSATEGAGMHVWTAAVCAPSSEPCDDTRVWDSEGSCTTSLGRDCVEADADAALRRWLADPHEGPDGAGETELLAVLDEHTVVVGYTSGSNLSFAGSRVQEAEDRVTVVVRFDAAPTTTDDGQPALFTAELRTGREIARIPTPIRARPIEIDVEIRPSP